MIARKGWTFSLEISRIMATMATTKAMINAMPVMDEMPPYFSVPLSTV